MSNLKANIHGLVLINKPLGLTSNRVLQKVKHLFGARKAGHTGSLDPLATGMLPICFGEATKFSQYLLDADKCYTVTGILGIKTSTSDAAGEVIASKDSFEITLPQLQQVLTAFIGETQQVPSMFSALKHQGTPLYKYARLGIEIERPSRAINIHNLVLHAFDGRAFEMTVVCSKGTYIRNLIEDIGEVLGVGAHVAKLHRVYTQGFNGEPMYSLEELEHMSQEARMKVLLPMECAILDLPQVQLNALQKTALYQGRVIEVDTKADGCVRLYENGQFLGVGELTVCGTLKVKRLLAQDSL